jgi:hypothetical protein
VSGGVAIASRNLSSSETAACVVTFVVIASLLVVGPVVAFLVAGDRMARPLIGGWEANFAGAGALIRPAALAMIDAYLRSGNDVVLPQMLIDPGELARFEGCAVNAGAEFVERFLMDDREAAAARFNRRGASTPDDPWHQQVRAIVAANGGADELTRCHDALVRLVAQRPDAVVDSRGRRAR